MMSAPAPPLLDFGRTTDLRSRFIQDPTNHHDKLFVYSTFHRLTMSRLAARSLRPFHRTLASVAPGPPPAQASTPFEVFDRNAKRRQRDRAATREGGEKSRVTDYLRAEVADRMAERFEVCFFSSLRLMCY